MSFLSLYLLQPRSLSALRARKLLQYYFFTSHLREPHQGSGQSALWSPLLFNLSSRWNSRCKGWYYLKGYYNPVVKKNLKIEKRKKNLQN
jgi:hypothetical protein